MCDIKISRANPINAEELANISKRAFHSDAVFSGRGEKGPPGYDSPQWQTLIMGKAQYYKFQIEGIIIGGAIVFNKGKGHYYLGRIIAVQNNLGMSGLLL